MRLASHGLGIALAAACGCGGGDDPTGVGSKPLIAPRKAPTVAAGVKPGAQVTSFFPYNVTGAFSGTSRCQV